MERALGNAARVSGGPSSLLLVALALSGVGLLGGPLILSLGRGRRATGAVVEGLTLGLVPTMVLLRLLPHVAGELGVGALALALFAFVLLRAFDRAHHRAAARVGRTFIYSALALHSFTDGVSLAAAVAVTRDRGADLALTAAFVIHRLPEGLFIATTLLPSYGWRRTLLRTFGLFSLTVVGGLAGGALLPHLSERWFDAVVAVGLGAMLQLVLHSHADQPTTGTTRALSSIALLVGVDIAIAVPTPHDLLAIAQPRELTVLQSSVPLFIETAPALLVGIVVSAVFRVLVNARLQPVAAGAFARALRLTALIPVGPAHVAQVTRGFLARGIDTGTALAFAVSTSAFALDGFLVSVRLLGFPLSSASALATLLGVAWLSRTRQPVRTGITIHHDALPARPRLSARDVVTLISRAIHQQGVWYVAGLAVAAGVEAGIDPSWLARVPRLVAVAVALVFALPLDLPLVALAPVAAMLLHKGLAIEAVVTLLVVGPMTSLALLRLFGARAIVPGAVVGSIAGCLAIIGAGLVGVAPSMHVLLAHPYLGERLCAVVIAVALFASLLALGPGLWFAQLTLLGDAASHESHDHGAHPRSSAEH